jgi:hypothetical protein
MPLEKKNQIREGSLSACRGNDERGARLQRGDSFVYPARAVVVVPDGGRGRRMGVSKRVLQQMLVALADAWRRRGRNTRVAGGRPLLLLVVVWFG